MKVYVLHHDFQYQTFDAKDQRTFPFEWFSGQSLEKQWEPIEIKIVEDKLDCPSADFPGFLPYAPIFSQKAMELYRERLIGEFLPLIFNQGKYYLFNTMNVIDVLDLEKSEVTRFKSSGRIKRIIKPVFKEEVVHQYLFKIPQTRGSIYVTDLFVQIYQAHGLTGLIFK